MNKIMTVKFEKDIGISDEEKNKLRYTLVLHFMEQLKQKGMYKVEEEKHDGKWVISASLVMPTIEAQPVKHGYWIGWNCSVCGKSTTHAGAKWCPVCGAKMSFKEI